MPSLRESSRFLLIPVLGILAHAPAAAAQSGRATFNGWVAFEGVAYVDSQPRATVVLRATQESNHSVYRAKTDEHGFFHFDGISLGEFVLHIEAPHFKPYEIAVYVPSDFEGNLAILLKRADSPAPPHH